MKKEKDPKFFIGHDGHYKQIAQMKKENRYVFGTCYEITWGFLLPCKSGVIWEQQTEGVCCHHVYMEGVLIPLRDVCEVRKGKGEVEWLINNIPECNLGYIKSDPLPKLWDRIRTNSHINFEFIDAPNGMPPNQEGFEWIIYHGHEEGYGNSFSLGGWKGKPIVLIYPNSD